MNGCRTCPVQSRCTPGTERRITRWEHEDLADAARGRLGCDPDPITLRRGAVEHPFGTIKAWMSATHFLTWRLKNVRSEMALQALACNIKRMVALISIRRLMVAIQT